MKSDWEDFTIDKELSGREEDNFFDFLCENGVDHPTQLSYDTLARHWERF